MGMGVSWLEDVERPGCRGLAIAKSRARISVIYRKFFGR